MESKKQLRIGGILLAAALISGALVSSAGAAVKGTCSMCHTMHNSQDGNTQAAVGAGAGWNGTTMNGGTNNGPQAMLLVSDCIGCHSNQGPETIVTINGNDIPIVYNLSTYPANALAGGNFNMVAGNDQYGHNVYGISTPDSIGIAPGAASMNDMVSDSCASSCHSSLALADTDSHGGTATEGRNGCRGCHVGQHHVPEASDASYRFLFGHDLTGGSLVPAIGIEDQVYGGKWEQSPSPASHNIYGKLTVGAGSIGETWGGAELTVSRFCTGCHSLFHASGTPEQSLTGAFLTVFNGGPSGSPWLRHPSEAPIPNSGEFADMSTTYNPAIPVGKDLVVPNEAAIELGNDHVICISCHRAHGSNWPDMLRFQYNMSAGAGSSNAGCFFCHTAKDGVPGS